MKPGTPELIEALETHAVFTVNAELALRALYLRDGLDDFVNDLRLLTGIIEIEGTTFRQLLGKVTEAVAVDSANATMSAVQLVESLELQIAVARRVVEILRADVERAKSEKGGER